MSEAMRPLIKASASVSLDSQSLRQSEGSHAQELTGSSNCRRTQPWRDNNVCTQAQLLSFRSCSSTQSLPLQHLYLMTVWVNKHESWNAALPSFGFKIFVSLKTLCISYDQTNPPKFVKTLIISREKRMERMNPLMFFWSVSSFSFHFVIGGKK